MSTELPTLPTYRLADEAAEMMGIKRRTLNRYAAEGKIAIFHHAGRAYVSEDAISDYWSRRHRAADQRRAAAEKRTRRRGGDAA